MTSARRRLPLLLAAAAVLALGWLVTPSPVPLYDGVGMPDEAYRFVVPPAGYRTTAPPSEARAAIEVNDGVSCCELEARSGEQGPQVSVYLPRAALAVAGAEVTVLATPLPAPAGPVPVAGQRFEGNTYRITASGPTGPGALTPEASRATVQVRALNADEPGPSIWYRSGDGASWRRLPGTKVGFDIVEAPFVGSGDYVLVRSEQNGAGTAKVLLGILAVPALLVVVLLVLRLRGGPPREDDDPDRDADEPEAADDPPGSPRRT